MSVETPAAEVEQAPSLMDTPVDQLPAGQPAAAVAEQGDPPAGAKDDLAETHTGAVEEGAEDEDQGANKDADKEPEGAPEAYEDFTAPEGVELNAETLDSFKEFAKGKNLTQADAQSLVDMASGLVANAQQAQVDAFIETANGWREATLNDPEIGGAKLAEVLPLATRARDQFGNDGLKELLNSYKLGDHPEVVRFFYNVGKATSEDSFVPGGTKTAGTPNFYTHPTSQKS